MCFTHHQCMLKLKRLGTSFKSGGSVRSSSSREKLSLCDQEHADGSVEVPGFSKVRSSVMWPNSDKVQPTISFPQILRM